MISNPVPEKIELLPTFLGKLNIFSNVSASSSASSALAMFIPTWRISKPSIVSTASLVRFLIPSKSPAATKSFLTIHEPPQHTILLKSRYDLRLPALIPPVGMNFICVYGAAIDLIMLSPPAASAGKNLTTSSPNSIATSTSEGLLVPGTIGYPLSRQCLTTLGLSPGLTINLAPAFIALSACSGVRTVPAPTTSSGNFSDIILIDSSAAAVLNVTSAAGSPPSIKAFASGSASLASSRAITGTIPILPSSSITAFIIDLLKINH